MTLTGVLAEGRHRPIASRFGRGRLDLRHAWLDPIIVVGPWILVAAGVIAALRWRPHPRPRT